MKFKERKSAIRLYRYNKRNVPEKEELDSRNCFEGLTIPHFRENSRWILAAKEVQDKLSEFEGGCRKADGSLFEEAAGLHRIGCCCDIGNGMVSGLDSAFRIRGTEGLNEDERSALINVYKAKDLNAYRNTGCSQYIFIREDIDAGLFAVKYPHFAEHFKPYLRGLSGRYSYNQDIPYWKFVFPRNKKLFELGFEERQNDTADILFHEDSTASSM